MEEGALEWPSLLSDSPEHKQLQRSFCWLGAAETWRLQCAQRLNTCSRAFSPNTLHLGSAFLRTGLSGDRRIFTSTSLSFPRSWLLASLRAPEPWIFVGEPGSGAGPRCQVALRGWGQTERRLARTAMQVFFSPHVPEPGSPQVSPQKTCLGVHSGQVLGALAPHQWRDLPC